MPSLGQNGGAINDSFAQQSAQTPSPCTGSRQATHSVGSAISSAIRAACRQAPRHTLIVRRKWLEMERDGDGSAFIMRDGSAEPAAAQAGSFAMATPRLADAWLSMTGREHTKA